jgi:hypothetical protein
MAAVWPAGPLPMMQTLVLSCSLVVIAIVLNKREKRTLDFSLKLFGDLKSDHSGSLQ